MNHISLFERFENDILNQEDILYLLIDLIDNNYIIDFSEKTIIISSGECDIMLFLNNLNKLFDYLKIFNISIKYIEFPQGFLRDDYNNVKNYEKNTFNNIYDDILKFSNIKNFSKIRLIRILY